MADKGRQEHLSRRKEALITRSDVLRQRAGELWREADRPFRLVDDGLARIRRVHPVTAGVAGIGLLLIKRRFLGRARFLGPLASAAWIALEIGIRCHQARKAGEPRRLPEAADQSEGVKRLPPASPCDGHGGPA